MTKHSLSDLDIKTACFVLKQYLIEEKIYQRKQVVNSKEGQKTYLDLNYLIAPPIEKMYSSLPGEDKNLASGYLSTSGFKAGSRDSWKYMCVNNIPGTFKMSEDFIKKLDNKQPNEIFVKRETVTKALNNILRKHYAIIKLNMYPGLMLTSGNDGKGLKKHSMKINNSSYKYKRRALNKALEALFYAICRIEEQENIKN